MVVDKLSAYLRIKRLHRTEQFRRLFFGFGVCPVQRLEKGQVFVIDPIPVGRVDIPEPVGVVHPVPESLEHLRRRLGKLCFAGIHQLGGILAAGRKCGSQEKQQCKYVYTFHNRLFIGFT